VKVEKKIQSNGSIVLNLGDAQRQVSSDIASVIWIRRE